MQAQYNVVECEKKLTSTIDVEHIKNMFLSYHKVTDESVKANALKVLFKALELSPDEQRIFNESIQAQSPKRRSFFFFWIT